MHVGRQTDRQTDRHAHHDISLHRGGITIDSGSGVFRILEKGFTHPSSKIQMSLFTHVCSLQDVTFEYEFVTFSVNRLNSLLTFHKG